MAGGSGVDRKAFAEKLRSRQTLFGIWMGIPHPMVAETLAQTGADFLLVDGEHGPIPPDSLGALLPATELHRMPVIYRVRWKTPELIKGALDHGVTGIMVPMVSSEAAAREVVSATKYPPLGTRGAGAWRASNYYLDEHDYFAVADAFTPVIVQIETREALDDIDRIAAVKGIDVLYVGPADLALSLGLTPGELHPDLLAACEKIAATAARCDLVAGIDIVSPQFVAAFAEMGFTFFTYGADVGFLVQGGRDAIASICAASGKRDY